MQLKIVIPSGTFRFNQAGELITQITEPFVLVEANNREEIVALYDQGQEHLAHAFTYQDEEITGLREDAAGYLQNFLLAEGAWYLQELNPADKDTASAPAPGETEIPDPQQGPADSPATSADLFVPTAEQRQLLRDIQTKAAALRLIQPEATAPWDSQVQKLLISQQIFGLGDLEKACVEGKAMLEQLVAQAKASGIPAEVIASNTSQGDVPEMEEAEEG